MKQFLLILISLNFISPALAGMSDIDLMVRNEIIYHFAERKIKVQWEQVQPKDFVKTHDPENCDLDVAADVEYFDIDNKIVTEVCYVCFRYKENDLPGQSRPTFCAATDS